MNAIQKSCIPTRAFMSRLPRRTSSTVAILAVVAAAIAASITAPEPTSGSALMVIAIARADCPPDCGPGGGTPSGPPGGGTEFIPPSMPSAPSYEPGRGQPPMDQNNGISIYNSAAPQPSQPAQPSQQPVQNQDGSYNRAANGEQQPINYKNAPNNQQLSSDWQQRSDQLNQQQSPQPPSEDGDNLERPPSEANNSEKRMERVSCEGVYSAEGGFSGDCVLNDVSQRQCIGRYHALYEVVLKYMFDEFTRNYSEAMLERQMPTELRWSAFYLLVRPGGQWDHKQMILNQGPPGPYHKIPPRNIEGEFYSIASDGANHIRMVPFDFWSNFHFGFMGKAAGFDLDTLLRGSHIPIISGNPDPADDMAIREGAAYFDALQRAPDFEEFTTRLQMVYRNHPADFPDLVSCHTYPSTLN